MRDYQTKANKGGVADSINAERFGAGEFNSIALELENAVSTSDQTLAPADGTGEVSTQLAMAMAVYGAGGAAFHIDTGAANAYVLNPVSPKESPPDYFDGLTVSFIAGNTNTGASTVNINSIGAKAITQLDGSALTGGEINGNVTIRYSDSNDRFELLAPGLFQTVNVFTASGSYSKPDGLKFVEVIVVGGGGGGGGVGPTGGTERASSGGGGGGGSSIKFIPASTLSASETVTVGAGGTGGADGSTNGSTGGTSSFGTHATATGGGGGEAQTASAATTVRNPGAGGLGASGNINMAGGPGTTGVLYASNRIGFGNGGNSSMGGGGRAISDTAANGGPYGGGGTGMNINISTAAASGGDGADGIVIVKEYF